jgi:hypothetical protein
MEAEHMKTGLLIIVLLVITGMACRLALKRAKQPAASAGDEPLPLNALYAVVVNNKWGYINSAANMVIEPRFSEAEDFSEGLAAVAMYDTDEKTGAVTKERWGFIDEAGKIVINLAYDKVEVFSEGRAVVMKDGMYGYINRSGEEVIPLIYEEAAAFHAGLACVKWQGKNGFIDTEGGMRIEPHYNRACWVSAFHDGLAPVYNGNERAGYIDTAGQYRIDPVFAYAGVFKEGRALVQPAGQSKYGYIDTRGNMVIPAMYDLGLAFSEGVAAVKTTLPNGTPIFKLIDTAGKTLADRLPYLFVGIFKEGLAGVEDVNHRWGFIDKTGKEVIAPQYAGVSLFRNGLSRMQTGHLFNGLQMIYINKTGKVVWK